MRLVSESLDEVGLASYTPPLALSARKALAGRLGDGAALEESHWAAVQTMLDEQIVARSDELKERALRRRASRVVAQLAARAARLADEERTTAESRAARAQAISQCAAKIDRNADDLADHLAKSLASFAQAWRADIEVVFTGRDREAIARDRVLARYRVDRALERVAPPLARALASLAPESELGPAQLAAPARALVRAAAASSAPDEYDAILAPLARTAIATLVEHLFALAVSPSPPPRASGLLRELAAFEGALA
jgi:hypothetical protein